MFVVLEFGLHAGAHSCVKVSPVCQRLHAHCDELEAVGGKLQHMQAGQKGDVEVDIWDAPGSLRELDKNLT